MDGFFQFFDILIDIAVSAFNYLIDLFSLGLRSQAYILDVLLLLPPYFYLGILPFIALFIVLFILNRG